MALKWQKAEINYLIELIADRQQKICNRETHHKANEAKTAAWNEVEEQFCARFGRRWPLHKMKELWKRQRGYAKKEFSNFKAKLRQTGGGPPPSPLSASTILIKELLPGDFVQLQNPFDDDVVLANEQAMTALDFIRGVHKSSSTIHTHGSAAQHAQRDPKSSTEASRSSSTIHTHGSAAQHAQRDPKSSTEASRSSSTIHTHGSAAQHAQRDPKSSTEASSQSNILASSLLATSSSFAVRPISGVETPQCHTPVSNTASIPIDLTSDIDASSNHPSSSSRPYASSSFLSCPRSASLSKEVVNECDKPGDETDDFPKTSNQSSSVGRPFAPSLSSTCNASPRKRNLENRRQGTKRARVTTEEAILELDKKEHELRMRLMLKEHEIKMKLINAEYENKMKIANAEHAIKMDIFSLQKCTEAAKNREALGYPNSED
ncbi:uncharacterized protein LOC129278086 isoform X2 [Lytechinus pictus]|uniref:uncharacterized protein LOC129278086 isoform X2 n=1 Tax=Lytechinus pictus TaxID=7653 RepID=UPI0030B9B30E